MRARKLSGSLLAGASVLLLSGAAFAQQQEQQMQGPAAGEGAPAGFTQENIAELQRMLNNAGYDAGPVEGISGPQTAAAVEQFQQAQGLEPTGTITSETLHALDVGGLITDDEPPEPAALPGDPTTPPLRQ